jgi:hypothetical protein
VNDLLLTMYLYGAACLVSGFALGVMYSGYKDS